ncbi:hypothetical protein CK203_029468 [Vitis vinifera]|uniref:Uncharacterized protein n=1 Tax=Vitis vinifera TaxID=29760 RepID=A0A438JCJ0_VITVI|nr:hypothetical protein CK203_029468 [Vitis vinifera]
MLRCCRFGYDYIGGYERMGGRPGYPDEKSHGRFMNRSGGYQNMPLGNQNGVGFLLAAENPIDSGYYGKSQLVIRRDHFG